jgi:hypothetical protein
MRLDIVSGNCTTVLDQPFVLLTLIHARLRTEDTGGRYLINLFWDLFILMGLLNYQTAYLH